MKRQMRNLSNLLVLAIALFFSSAAYGAGIQVSQESAPGAGDFDANVLGVITPFDGSGGSAADYYQYGTPYAASFNGPAPALVSDRSHLFMVNADDGLSLFIVHDKPEDGSGGQADMQFNVFGNTATAGFKQGDDPGEGLTDLNPLFKSSHNWAPCCTDGLALGDFAGPWKTYVQFTNTNGWTKNGWRAISANGEEIELKLENGRRVRLAVLGGFRMTGGGKLNGLSHQGQEIEMTLGFTLHCVPSEGTNNLQINWGKGNKFHLDNLTNATCRDLAGINEAPPVAGFTTIVGSGEGSVNGVPGAKINFTFTDEGEPGANDNAKITIVDANGDIVIGGNQLIGGNYQAHSDQN